jgi:hypothetical protein
MQFTLDREIVAVTLDTRVSITLINKKFLRKYIPNTNI